MISTVKKTSPLAWVPTVYFAMGLPFVVLNMVSAVMFKDLGISDTRIAFWTSLIMWPWTIKFLWSPFLEIFRTKKFFVVTTQLLSGVLFGLAALALHMPHFFAVTVGVFAVVAFSGATHDIAADGVYMSELSTGDQARYIGWQGAFYNIAKVFAMGGLVYLAGALKERVGIVEAWMIVMALCGALLASAALSQLSYILEIDLYRGVKLMQLIPIGLFALAYLLVFAYEETGAREAVLAHAGQRGEKNRVKRFNAYFGELMQTPMKLGWFLAIVVIAVAAVFMLLVFAYYMYRTGNSTTTSARELAFRNFLENTLIARPRTKEMIVGWPMLLLFIWSLRRRMKFLPMIFGTGMTIGLVSVVNTFLHIRTPFLLSLLRTGWGILFGLLIGTAVVIVAELIYRLVRRICGVTNG